MPLSVPQIDPTTATYHHALASDTTGITSPQFNKVDSGSFIADATTAMISIEVSASQQDPIAAAGSWTFYYADSTLVTPPLIINQQGAPRANVTVINIGNTGAYPATSYTKVKVTGLVIGRTYNWELAAGAVGYADLLALPDAPIAMSTSKANPAPSATQGRIGDRIVAVASATKLHVILQNHSTTVSDQILTGSGMPLTATRTTGAVAVSPNGLRVAVTNYNLNTVSVFDLSIPEIPVQVGSDIASTPSPFAVIWSDNDTFWVTDLFTVGHIQKFTGASGASPAAGTITTIDGALTFSITQLSITPDASKIVFTGSQPKVYWVNTATNGVTSVAAPSTAAIAACALSNTTAIVLYGATPSAAILTFASSTFGTAASSSAWASPLGIWGLSDAFSALVIENVANTTRGNIRHLMLPSSGSTSTIVEYTNWAATGTPTCATIDEHGNIYVCATLTGGTAWTITQWFGGVTNIRPSYNEFYGEKAIVQATPAH